MMERIPLPEWRLVDRLRLFLADPAVRYGLMTFFVLRVFLSIWAVIVLAFVPLPTEINERVRPFLGEPQLNEGISGRLLGPWQRFDTMHYLRIAHQGYENTADSVFPPLYPLGMRVVGFFFAGFLSAGERHLLAGIILSNLACIGLFILLYRVTAAEVDEPAARRAVLFLAVFPTSFYLLAGYTESIFILLALGSFWLARHGRVWRAGLLGFLASMTRLTGWILVVPLAFEYYRRLDRRMAARPFPLSTHSLAILLPPLGLLAFLGIRQLLGLPPIGQIYENFWLQTTGFPGSDLLTAVHKMLDGKARFVLYFDFFCTFFLLATTVLAFRRLGPTYGLYSAMLLVFMLLPTSAQKPLFSFSRYALAFFPTFMILGVAGKNPWLHRLIFYLSVALLLYLSGQFFVWGWVA